MQRSDSCSCTAAEHAVEVGALAVEHVHEDDARQPELLGAVPHARGVHLDAHHAGDDDERAFDDAQRRDRVGLEAGVARRVDQVDLAALPLEVAERRRRATSGGAARPPPSRRPCVPASIAPSRFVFPAWKSSASTSEVLPVPRWPTTATLRIFPASMGIESSCGGRGRVGWPNPIAARRPERERPRPPRRRRRPPRPEPPAENRPSRPRPTDATAAPTSARNHGSARSVPASSPCAVASDPDAERQVVRAPPQVVRDPLAERVRDPDRRHQLGGDDRRARPRTAGSGDANGTSSCPSEIGTTRSSSSESAVHAR